MPKPRDHASIGGIVAATLMIALLCGSLGVLARIPNNDLVLGSTLGVLLLAACAGWGSTAAFALAPRRCVDLGLRALWGMSIVLVVAGFALLLHVFGAAAISIVIAVGLVQAGWHLWRARVTLGRLVRSMGRMTPVHAMVYVAIGTVAGWAYLGAAADSYLNPYDDSPAYLPLVQRVLATGTLFEPFSERRALSLGGQTLLQAMLSVRTSFDQLQLLDSGVCKILLLILALGHGYRQRAVAWYARVLASSIILGFPQHNINAASYYSGACFILGLARTIDWLRPSSQPRTLVLVALTAVGAITLRNSYAPTVLVICGVAMLPTLRNIVRQRRELYVFTGAMVIMMVPWLRLSVASTGSPFYPLILGNGNPDGLYQGERATLLDFGAHVLACLAGPTVIITAPVFLFAALMLRDRHARRPSVGLWSGAVVGFFVLLWQVDTLDPFSAGRYIFPSLAAAAIWTTLSSGSRGTHDTLAWCAVLLAVALATFSGREATAYTYAMYSASIQERLHAHGIRSQPQRTKAQVRAQALTHPGAQIAVMLDEPAFLDFRRNKLFMLDLPGTISPKPGLPFFRGPEPLLQYFRAQGIRYVLFVRPAASLWLYREGTWLAQGVAREVMQGHADYMIDLLQTIPQLATRERIRFEEAGIVLLDLEQP